MKKIFLLLAFTFLSASLSTLFAADKVSQSNFSSNLENKLALTVNLGDISNLSSSEIANKIDTSIENMYPEQKTDESQAAELECTVSVTVTAGVGSNTIAVTATVTGPCSRVRAEARKMATQLVAEVKKLLS
nr:hypothetical protein [uncultured Bacteroides sp.]